jgi:SGNH hydrolase-like domain, acetyltransferase AlgX
MTSAAKSQSDDMTAKPKRKWLRRTFIASQVVLGLGLGLVIAEQVFAKRDDKAFPHVNFYVPDAELGVRLEPGATMRFRFRDNPTTDIHVNAQGYRGEDWPAPGGDEIIVLGDSQVFGLGVENDETFSAMLAAHTGRSVLNAGVPTYGPPEYLALAAELLAERKPKTLVVTINFLNDPFEIDRPNKDRHAVWDGWAVRAEHAPADVRSFPGRKWLYSKSHAFYAFRRWQHERGKAELPVAGEAVDFGTPSEGTFEDLVVDSQAAHAERDAKLSAAEQALNKSRQRIGAVDQEIVGKRDRLDELVREASSYEFDHFDSEVARRAPGDIVEEDLGEESRSVVLTAALIRQAARERADHLAKLQRQQQRKGNHEIEDLLSAEQQLLAERAALREQVAAGIPLLPAPKSVFDAYMQQLKALCEQHGTELVVLALPVDVQVDPSEWDKYGVDDRPDMSESLVLLDDLVANAEQLGIRALHVTEALRAAEPGAFLDADIHMTARGHAAVAEALAARLDAPLPIELPGTGLPEGRSFVPAADEWDPIGEVTVTGSTKAGCSTQIEREWLRVRCRRPSKNKREGYGGIEVLAGATATTMTMQGNDGQSLVTPLTIGEPLTARFVFGKQVRELRITWPLGDDGKPKFVGELVDVEGQAGAKPASAAVEQLCKAHVEVTGEQWCAEGDDWSAWNCRESCAGLWGDPNLSEACRAAFGADHRRVLSCVQHDPLSAPACPAGSVHAFASNACFAACDVAHPCASGVCTPWQGGGVCMG